MTIFDILPQLFGWVIAGVVIYWTYTHLTNIMKGKALDQARKEVQQKNGKPRQHQEVDSTVREIRQNEVKPIEKPKVQLPKVELPKVELPKIEVPKVELPKIGDELNKSVGETKKEIGESVSQVLGEVDDERE